MHAISRPNVALIVSAPIVVTVLLVAGEPHRKAFHQTIQHELERAEP